MDDITARTSTDVTLRPPIRFHIRDTLSPGDLGLLWRDLEARADITFFLSWDWMGVWIAELETRPLVLVGEAAVRWCCLACWCPGCAARSAG